VPVQLGPTTRPVHGDAGYWHDQGVEHTAAPPEGPDVDEPAQCSAKGCRADATSVLVWNNPRLHTAGREKTWAACDDHLDSLSRFLDLRGFLRRVDPIR
jgi:hypothetical protein